MKTANPRVLVIKTVKLGNGRTVQMQHHLDISTTPYVCFWKKEGLKNMWGDDWFEFGPAFGFHEEFGPERAHFKTRQQANAFIEALLEGGRV